MCRNKTELKTLVKIEHEAPAAAAAAASAADSGKAGKSRDGPYRPSSKIKALVRELDAVVGDDQDLDVKAIVFSQWASMLNLVEHALEDAGICYTRLDGSMPQAARAAALDRFKKSPHVRVMLLTMRVGGVGLNLTAASHVYLCDPWWNPAIEAQAIDRVHRIGQKREVVVKRLIARDTVEERVLLLHKRKELLARNVLSGPGGTRHERLDDLKLLFGVG